MPRLLTLAALLVGGLATAAVVGTDKIEELALAAPVVIRGNVVSTAARWSPDRRAIFTYTQIEVMEGYKGRAGAMLEVRQPGGEVGGIGQRVSGAATFQVGEEAVLFLEPAPDETSTFNLLALAAGKVELRQGRARRDLRGLATPQPGAGVRALRPDDLGDRSTFLRRLRATCARSAR